MPAGAAGPSRARSDASLPPASQNMAQFHRPLRSLIPSGLAEREREREDGFRSAAFFGVGWGGRGRPLHTSSLARQAAPLLWLWLWPRRKFVSSPTMISSHDLVCFVPLQLLPLTFCRKVFWEKRSAEELPFLLLPQHHDRQKREKKLIFLRSKTILLYKMKYFFVIHFALCRCSVAASCPTHYPSTHVHG